MKLLHGDCFKVETPKCRLLLTDIPYETVSRTDNGLRKLDKETADVKTFDVICFLEHFFESADIFVIFCGNEQYSTIYDFFNKKSLKKLGTTRQLVWCKTNPSPMNGEYVYLSSIENAVWFKKKGTGKLNNRCKKNFFVYPNGSSKLHPTEKNLKLFEELILDNTSEGDTVVDTCMGSGTTGVACLRTGRDFIGIELDDNYFEVAKKRIMDETIYGGAQ